MADIFKFPKGGYDVTVCRKQDIIDCIDENVIDKDIALTIVDQCESDIAEFLTQGRWTGLPFIGNVRIPEGRTVEEKLNQTELIEEAREILDTEQFVMFRRQLLASNAKYIKQQRYFNYITSQAVTKNRRLYNKLCKTKGENYAKAFLLSSKYATNVSSDSIEDDQQ